MLALYGHEQPTRRSRRARKTASSHVGSGGRLSPSTVSSGNTPRSGIVPTPGMRPYSVLAAECRSLEARVTEMSAAMAKSAHAEAEVEEARGSMAAFVEKAAEQRKALESIAVERDLMQQRVYELGAVDAEKEELKTELAKVQGEHAELTTRLDQAQVEDLVASMELNERRLAEAEDEAASEAASVTSSMDLDKLRIQRNDLKCQLTAVLQSIQSPRGDSELNEEGLMDAVTLRLERDQLREQLQRQASKVVAAAEQEDQLRAVISQLEGTKRERDMYAWRLLGESSERGTAQRPGQLAPLPPAQYAAERMHTLAEELAEQMASEMGRKSAEEAANSHRTIESLTMALAATKSQVLYLREQGTDGQRDGLASEEREAELVAEKERLGRQAKELAKQLALRIKERDERAAELGAAVENLAAVTAEREQLARQLAGATAETAAARSAVEEARAKVPTVPVVSEA